MNQSYFEILQVRAVDILLAETFRHINSTAQELYQSLGKANARLLYTSETRFINKGIVYPPTNVSTIPYGSQIPTLHYSLLNELDTINRLVAQADYYYVKNFYAAVISQSHNSIVLDGLLPSILVNALKLALPTHDFKSIDMGVYVGVSQEPLSVTQQNIQKIKDHYHNTITTIQHLLMDKLLLQS
jgi:hypothetical protein